MSHLDLNEYRKREREKPQEVIAALKKMIARLQAENKQLKKRIQKMYAGDLSPESRLSGYKVIVGEIIKRRDELLDENKRWKKALEWFRKDLKEIKSMNEPTFFTICQRWLPRIKQVLKETNEEKEAKKV